MTNRSRWTRGLALLALAAGMASAAVAQPAQPSGEAAAIDDYRIGIEDELQVFVWGEKDLTVHVKVRPDGKITVPLINDVFVVGLTASEVRLQVAEQLATFIREPTVSVIVEAIKSYRVYFLGEIQRQGAMNFFRPTRLLQGVAAAGGLTEFSKEEIVILREENGQERRIEINYKKLLSGDSPQQNIVLQPGDTLICK